MGAPLGEEGQGQGVSGDRRRGPGKSVETDGTENVVVLSEAGAPCKQGAEAGSRPGPSKSRLGDLLRKACELRLRGYGYRKIAEELRNLDAFGGASRSARAKRIERLLKTWASRLGRDNDVDSFCSDLSSGRVALPEETAPQPEETASNIAAVRRLGRTERLVLEVLLHYSSPSPTPLTPSVILREIREREPVLGHALSPKAVYSALRRLVDKGVVVKVGRGEYRISPALIEGEPYYVENLRVGERIVWNKRERGRPATLSEALGLAEDMGLGERYISEMELGVILKDPEDAELLRSLRERGVKGVKVYFSEKEGPKVEVLMARPPLTASTRSYLDLIELYRKSLDGSLETILRAIMAEELHLRDHGLRGVVRQRGAPGRRVCHLLEAALELYGCRP
ncbi:MAG: hypothetical protein ABWK01_06845 [Infirmifilum sp.]